MSKRHENRFFHKPTHTHTIIIFPFLQSEKDEADPFADRRRPTIADREDEYRQKRRRLIISPERSDPFADG